MELDSSILERALALDEAGFVICPDENAGYYFERVAFLRQAEEGLINEVAEAGTLNFGEAFNLVDSERIPESIIAEAGDETQDKFGFQLNWVPGYYLTGGELGRFFGGGLVSCEDGNGVFRSVFVLRKEFKVKAKLLFYRRKELLAHELCHAARAPLMDGLFEEYFAYRTAGGGSLRKIFGAGFNGRFDPWIFLLPALILLGAQFLQLFGKLEFPIWPFWVLAFAGPGFLLAKGLLIGRTAAKAAKVLKNNGCCNPEAVLFRLNSGEITDLAHGNFGSFDRAHQGELRWEVIKKRFFNLPVEEEKQI